MRTPASTNNNALSPEAPPLSRCIVSSSRSPLRRVHPEFWFHGPGKEVERARVVHVCAAYEVALEVTDLIGVVRDRREIEHHARAHFGVFVLVEEPLAIGHVRDPLRPMREGCIADESSTRGQGARRGDRPRARGDEEGRASNATHGSRRRPSETCHRAEAVRSCRSRSDRSSPCLRGSPSCRGRGRARRDLLASAEVREPVPGVGALGGDHESVSEGLDRGEKGVEARRASNRAGASCRRRR